MLKSLAGLAAVVCLTVAAAQAQETASDALVQRLAGACTAEGGFGKKFGEPRSSMVGMRRAGPDWPEVETLEVLYTPNSGRMQTVSAWVDTADAATAAALVKAVFDANRALAPAPLRAEWDAETEQGEIERQGLRIEIGALGKSAIVGCVQPELRQRAEDEVFGRVRIEARPQPPMLSLPPPPAANTCQSPEARAPFVAGLETSLADIMNYGQSGNAYQTQLLQWYGQSLKDKGAWTEDDERAFAMKILGDPAIGQEVEANMKTLMTMLGLTQGLASALERKDEAQACVTGVKLHDVMRSMIASNERQWSRAREMLDSESRRLGVAIDR